MRKSSATWLFGALLASHTQVSSDARVKRDPARTHGTSSPRTPHSGQATRRISQRTTHRTLDTSR